ncbi:MAG: hypothetical protein PVI92_11915 [Chromatiales bacterium]|jgi:hypothetical protein
MALKAGTLSDFDDSMAEAMENALATLWLAKTGQPLPDATQEDRRLMFIAIAQGVVRHLKDNAAGAFDISVNVSQNDTPLVNSYGTTSTSGAHNHTVTVTQNSGAGNKVQSSGSGTVNINTSGDLY